MMGLMPVKRDRNEVSIYLLRWRARKRQSMASIPATSESITSADIPVVADTSSFFLSLATVFAVRRINHVVKPGVHRSLA